VYKLVHVMYIIMKSYMCTYIYYAYCNIICLCIQTFVQYTKYATNISHFGNRVGKLETVRIALYSLYQYSSYSRSRHGACLYTYKTIKDIYLRDFRRDIRRGSQGIWTCLCIFLIICIQYRYGSTKNTCENK
jgi:hypothetical protein